LNIRRPKDKLDKDDVEELNSSFSAVPSLSD
jgi:hypothetical protein